MTRTANNRSNHPAMRTRHSYSRDPLTNQSLRKIMQIPSIFRFYGDCTSVLVCWPNNVLKAAPTEIFVLEISLNLGVFREDELIGNDETA
ncbi:hypothetical protein Y032_0132g1696 [Ancylostoma ceylanicum]|uniref:Uncharacterized protein n=1 Tax=Ancylostoma ceylanicum TaxID=53326 RepID=A0A016T6Q7_9BILA|nr:hypothetical protein Y032_0132g1696 [Ancylostoma ceylanicum]